MSSNNVNESFFNISANALYNSVSSVKNFTNLWSESTDKNYSLLMKKDILRIGTILQNIFENGKSSIEIPKIIW